MLAEKSRNWLKLVPYAIYLMNNQVSSRTGFTPTARFQLRIPLRERRKS